MTVEWKPDVLPDRFQELLAYVQAIDVAEREESMVALDGFPVEHHLRMGALQAEFVDWARRAAPESVQAAAACGVYLRPDGSVLFGTVAAGVVVAEEPAES